MTMSSQQYEMLEIIKMCIEYFMRKLEPILERNFKQL